MPAAMLTIALIAITCVVSFLAWQQPRLMDRLVFWPPAIQRGDYHRFITYGFVHADGMHLFFNMFTLYFFGRFVEQLLGQRYGWAGFVLFYALGLIGSILPSWWRHKRDATYRSLGASGAVSACLFAFCVYAPWQTIYIYFLPVPAIVYAVLYVGYSIWMDKRGGDAINHSAHLWGGAIGVIAAFIAVPNGPAHFVRALMGG